VAHAQLGDEGWLMTVELVDETEVLIWQECVINCFNVFVSQGGLPVVFPAFLILVFGWVEVMEGWVQARTYGWVINLGERERWDVQVHISIQIILLVV
jgi:hypothetical protein